MAPPKTELKAEKGKQSYSREGHLKKYIQKIKSNNSKKKKKKHRAAAKQFQDIVKCRFNPKEEQ